MKSIAFGLVLLALLLCVFFADLSTRESKDVGAGHLQQFGNGTVEAPYGVSFEFAPIRRL